MDIYCIKVIETIEKRSFVEAEDAATAQLLAAKLDAYEFNHNKVVASQFTVFPVMKDRENEHEDHDPCDGYYDCDACPNHCEVCGSCAKEADFVPNRGECADCKFRCSACNACTIDG